MVFSVPWATAAQAAAWPHFQLVVSYSTITTEGNNVTIHTTYHTHLIVNDTVAVIAKMG